MEALKSILQFTINTNQYSIFLVDKIDNNECVFGQTDFIKLTIEIKKDLTISQINRTLKHELTHVWLYECGHTGEFQDEQKTFTIEDVCEIVACSNDWINEILNKFKKQKRLGTEP